MTLWSLAALAILASQGRTVDGWGPVPDEQLAVLQEFYRATNGPEWKDNSGWLTEESPCEWYGILCDVSWSSGRWVSDIVSIFLPDNGLRGVLPESLVTLPKLEAVVVTQNHLYGDVPVALLGRWDNDELYFRGAGNNFRNMIQRVRVVYESWALCAEDSDVSYIFDAQEYGPTRLETIRCVPGSDSETRCLIKEGNGPYLERLSRALVKLDYNSFEPEYTEGLGASTHQAFLTTTVWWGDGTEKSVMTYGGQGTLGVWMAQELFLRLLDDVYWKSEHFEETCPSAKED